MGKGALDHLGHLHHHPPPLPPSHHYHCPGLLIMISILPLALFSFFFSFFTRFLPRAFLSMFPSLAPVLGWNLDTPANKTVLISDELQAGIECSSGSLHTILVVLVSSFPHHAHSYKKKIYIYIYIYMITNTPCLQLPSLICVIPPPCRGELPPAALYRDGVEGKAESVRFRLGEF